MIVLRFDRELLKSPSKFEHHLFVEAKKTKLDNINECVLKFYFKKKHIIVKGKSAIGALKCIFRVLKDYPGSKSSKLPEDNLYLHFVSYFWGETRGFTFRIKVLTSTSNHFDLLKTEQQALWAAQYDPMCLNNTIDAYIPVYREETRSHGWLNQGSLLTFLKWKQKNSQQRAPESYATSNQTHILSQ